jgi:plasmid stability protein
MGQIIVRNLDDAVIARLKARAIKNNTSLEQTVRDILAAATDENREAVWKAIDEARGSIIPIAADTTALVREDRER